MSNPSNPKCPKCGSNRQVYADFTRDGKGTPSFWCASCKVAFDLSPDEGGTHSNDPTKRIELQEHNTAAAKAWQKDFRQRYGKRRFRHRKGR